MSFELCVDTHNISQEALQLIRQNRVKLARLTHRGRGQAYSFCLTRLDDAFQVSVRNLLGRMLAIPPTSDIPGTRLLSSEDFARVHASRKQRKQCTM